jgi:hypothetical protein
VKISEAEEKNGKPFHTTLRPDIWSGWTKFEGSNTRETANITHGRRQILLWWSLRADIGKEIGNTIGERRRNTSIKFKKQSMECTSTLKTTLETAESPFNIT